MKQLLNAMGLVLFLGLTFSGQVQSQNRPRITDSLALARICVSESSLPVFDGQTWVSQRRRQEAWGRDCWAIHEVLLNGSARHDMRYVEFAKAECALVRYRVPFTVFQAKVIH